MQLVHHRQVHAGARRERVEAELSALMGTLIETAHLLPPQLEAPARPLLAAHPRITAFSASHQWRALQPPTKERFWQGALFVPPLLSPSSCARQQGSPPSSAGCSAPKAAIALDGLASPPQSPKVPWEGGIYHLRPPAHGQEEHPPNCQRCRPAKKALSL